MIQRTTGLLLLPATLSAWLCPLPLRAASPPEQPPSEPVLDAAPSEDEQSVEQARRLFDEGVTRFETADYAGAIELWTEAFGLVPNEPANADIKAKLIANLAAAHERAYAVDSEVSHLNQAKILIERYRGVLEDIYLDEIEREKELAWVSERLAKIEAELQAVAEREAAERAANQPSPPEPEPRLAPGAGLIIGGSVALGLGVGGLGVMVTGMVLGSQNDDVSDLPTIDLETRAERFRTGRLGNALAIAGGVGGSVLVAAGVALIVVGLKKKRAAGEHESARVMIAPDIAATRLGLGVVGRF